MGLWSDMSPGRGQVAGRVVDVLLSIHDVLRSGGRSKWTFGREDRVRSALKLLAETCWRHRSRWRGRVKHARAAELIGAASESDSGVFVSCGATIEQVIWTHASGHGRREGAIMRCGPALSHDARARAVAKKMEVRSRVGVSRVGCDAPSMAHVVVCSTS
jgi:hypothetical protein